MYEIITPPYEVVEIYVEWINECADMSDHFRIIGDLRSAKEWEASMIEAQEAMSEYLTTLQSQVIFNKYGKG